MSGACALAGLAAVAGLSATPAAAAPTDPSPSPSQGVVHPMTEPPSVELHAIGDAGNKVLLSGKLEGKLTLRRTNKAGNVRPDSMPVQLLLPDKIDVLGGACTRSADRKDLAVWTCKGTREVWHDETDDMMLRLAYTGGRDQVPFGRTLRGVATPYSSFPAWSGPAGAPADFLIVFPTKPHPSASVSAPAGGTGGLPVTGTNTLMYVGGGAALLGVGSLLVVLGRRRRAA
jgi:LPXTG-motif cell wall-anchored protein